jgi:hypothetical protein
MSSRTPFGDSLLPHTDDRSRAGAWWRYHLLESARPDEVRGMTGERLAITYCTE